MVTDNFSKSSLDLNGMVTLTQPTALQWGPDGRLYVTEVDGSVKVLTVAFGDPDATDAEAVNAFYVTEAETIGLVKNIPNYDDDGSASSGNARQVTGISVVQQYAADGSPVMIFGEPAVTVYVTSSDSRIGGSGDGDDTGLDTNSSTITRLDQTETGWTAIDIVRGLARSEENHALNGLEVIQEVDAMGNLVSERLIVANGGNTNGGAPSNNFAGQQETAYSGAILEVDLDQLKTMDVLTDPLTGRQYIYEIPTLNDPTRPGNPDDNDPFGGNDGLNAGKIDPDGPVQIYSAGYRNSYDVEVTEDGRVWTYDNGSNNSWGGRPIGEAGDDGGAQDYAQWIGYIATNLNNGDINTGDPINLEDWDPKNYDQFHEITRSDDLAGRELSAGPGGATTYQWQDPDSGETLTLVYGGHPNPTRASGGQSGLLFTAGDGVSGAFLMVSNVDRDGPDSSDYDAVIAFLMDVEARYDTVAAGDLTGRVVGVTPGVLYYITDAGNTYLASDYPEGTTTINGETVLGASGLPADFDEVVANINPVEGNYLEGGYTDGAVDAGKGSINGLTEYTSTILDDPENGIKMSGAILAASLNQGSLTVIGRNANGVVETTTGVNGQTQAAERTTIDVSGAPLGLASIGDDLSSFDGQTAFQGSVWATIFKQNGPVIEILQPNNGAVPLAGSEIIDPTDHDGDGVDHFHDPFEFGVDNGFELNVNERIELNFSSEAGGFSGTIFDTGLMGAALDGVTPNRDAKTAAEGFEPDKQQDGLYDLAGNILPGGNAPIFQIKKVVGGTVVGSANTARDAMHVGIKPGSDVERLAVSSKVKNWIPSVTGGLKPGQLTGIMLGDGTQANYLRLMFGAMMIDGVLAAGFEVGYEIDDSYTVLTRVAVPQLSGSDVAIVDLMLEIDIGNGFAVDAGYQFDDGSAPVMLDLGGFALPPGVLQDVLTGAHTITDGDTTLPSGAAIGFLAETSPSDAASEDGLAAIDFYNLQIEALGNAIQADTAAEVGTQGTDGFDTIVYTGSDTNLAPLADNVENFDGSGSSADFTVTGNSGDNMMIAGSGTNTFIGGGGADSIQGSFDNIDGSVITDFMPDDHFMILGSILDADDVGYSLEAGVVKLTFTDPQTGNTAVVSLSGDQFDGFDPLNGPSTFHIEPTEFGTKVSYDIETVIYRINTGGVTVAAIDGGLDWEGDTSSGLLSGNTSDTYSNSLSNEESEIDLSNLPDATVPWQVFVTERSDNDAANPRVEYAFPVTIGETYSITLFYTENWPGIFNSVDRIFDVEVEGSVPDAFADINPLQEAIELYGANASEQELLGVGLSRTYTLTAQDDTLNLAFLHDSQNPKINAIEIRQFGFGVVPPDRMPPAVELIWVEEPVDNDSPIIATVMITDNAGIDLSTIDGDELIFTGIDPATVTLAGGSDAIVVSDDGKTVTIKYQLTPPADTNAWSSGDYTVGVAADSYADNAGNGVAAFETGFDIVSSDNILFELGFELAGEPLDEGGFDEVLGGISDASAITTIEGGDLVVNTSDGDISNGQSANDFIKYVDLSSDALNKIHISTRFDNPFPAALAAQGLATDAIPNYAQQGILFGLGTQGSNELVKLVLGGNGGNVVQIWSNPDSGVGIDTIYQLSDLLVNSSFGLTDISAVEMTLSIDKAAGTVTPIVTLFGHGGAVLGGLRATPMSGFVTAQAEALPPAVLANLTDPAAPTAVGVTSNDYRSLDSFEASWEYLNVTSPDLVGGATLPIAIAEAPTVTESGDSGVTMLAFALATDASVNDDITLTFSTDGGATTQTQTVTFTDGATTLTIEVPNDAIDNGPETVAVQLIGVDDGQYAIDPNADTASGTVMEDDQATLIAITEAPTVAENGDTGVTLLAFGLTTDASVNDDITLTFSTDGGATTQTQTVTFTDGATTLTIEVPNDDIDNGPETVAVQLIGVDDGQYAIDPNADTASGTVMEDDQVSLIAITDAPAKTESGDSGVTLLAFGLATDAGLNSDIMLTFSTDGGATTQTQTVTFTAGTATLAIEVPNDDVDNGPESVSVQLIDVDDSQYAIDPNADTATGSVLEDDMSDGFLVDLDFELSGEPLDEGGFDATLGGVTDAQLVTVEGGELVVNTSNGDIINGQSANDFIKYVDLSGDALNEIHIATRFDNPFPAALAAQGLSTDTIPNYAQQGIVFGLGSQDAGEAVKLVFGGNKGNSVQIWSEGAIDTRYQLSDMLADASLGLTDVASVAMTLIIDKAAGSVTPIVTLFGHGGAVLGGLRATPMSGFVTAQAEALPPAVLANLTDPAAPTAVGVTSNDYLSLDSFEANWEYLNVTSPDLVDDSTLPIAIADAPTVTESGDSGVTMLAFALATDASVNDDITLTFSTDGGATTQTQTVTFTDGTATLMAEVPNDAIDNGPDSVSMQLIGVDDSRYVIDSNADTATGSVLEDDMTDGFLVDLDFELSGEPLDEGGFDEVLGGISDASAITTIEGGDLVVNTSDGDISNGQSANDFIKYVDLSSDTLNEIHIATRFDNPFPAALAAQGLATDAIPNYAQQGIVFGLGTQGENELVKLVFGGNNGNAVQVWSNPNGGGIDTVYMLSDLLMDSSLGLSDVAAVEMLLVIDKAAGTVTPRVTLYGADGAILGGLRAEPTAGFVTAKTETMPSAVLANLTDPAAPTAVGVTSNDYLSLDSFEASWEYLNVTSPDLVDGPTLPIAIADAPTVTESGDSGVTTLAFALATVASVNDDITLTFSTDGGATTETQMVTFVDGAATLTVDVINDATDDGADVVSVLLVGTDDSQYAIDPNADTAMGSVTEDEPPAPSSAEQVLANAALETPDTYAENEIGSAVITVTPGAGVQESNYGDNSFMVTNTGDKKIAAIFLDVRGALYGDSVFDPDGKGGDTIFKEWQIDSSGGTGALEPAGYEHYFLPGTDPDPTDPGDNGGYRGALVKFSATLDGGFSQGEVVGFSGDMDPNSIAGMEKDGASGVDTGSVPAWDVGGVSGAELIGSMVYIEFTDGSIASAQLMGDGSQSGAQAVITEGPQNLEASLSVNGVMPGELGSYGGDVPTVLVSGPPGEWVRVIMTKGHQPVANTTGNLVDIVEWRLADEGFPVNNAAEFQFVDVQLGADGTADVSDQFVYNQFLNGTSSFGGDDTLPLGFVAAVIDDPATSEGFALGPVSQPVYLSSNGNPVITGPQSGPTSNSMSTPGFMPTSSAEEPPPAEAETIPMSEDVSLVGLNTDSTSNDFM